MPEKLDIYASIVCRLRKKNEKHVRKTGYFYLW